MDRFWARCKLGSDLNPGPSLHGMNLGLLGLPSMARSYRPALKTQSPEQGGGCRCLPNLLDRLWFSLHQLRSCPPKPIAWNRALPCGVFSPSSAGYAAAAIGTDLAWCSGSYTSPLTQSRWSNTASFRATATAALFFAFFPPRSQSRSPYRRRSVSGPNGPKMYCALPTSSLRTIVSPALLIPNCGWLSPESSCFGTNPRYGPTSRLFANRFGFSKVNT